MEMGQFLENTRLDWTWQVTDSVQDTERQMLLLDFFSSEFKAECDKKDGVRSCVHFTEHLVHIVKSSP